ncbi:MAG TPA: hypothetical protein VG167_13760 [Verrucomicrobiae bacterium]|nr:hypothetical protein [Verrucomicrobiae bacterium]
MKKLIVRILLGLVLLVGLALVAVSLFLDGAVRRGIETFGPMLTKVDVKLQSVSLSLFSGSGQLKGLVVGNPAGFKTPSAIQVNLASMALQPSSVLSDKIIIRSIELRAPEITYETDLKGNNLSKILANLQAASGPSNNNSTATKSTGASRKLEVDDFLISGGKIHVSVTALGGRSATVPLPDIHFTDLGKGPDGITAAELAQKVFAAIEHESVQAASSSVADLTKDAAGLTKGLGKDAGSAADKVTKGLGNLFKKP